LRGVLGLLVLVGMTANLLFLNNYKNLIETKISSPDGFGGASNNSVPKIQACAGLDGSGKMGILLMNTDTTGSETIEISWGKPAKGNAIMRKLSNDLSVETPIPISEITRFNDTNRTGVTIALGSAEAALIEVMY
jgi:hypothetical protein